MGGVEQVRIGRRLERSRRSLGVAPVALANVGEDLGIADTLPGLRELGGAARRTSLRRCSDKDFDLGLGDDNGADIATVKHCAGRRAGEIALERQERGAHLRNCRYDRGGLADGVALELAFIECRGVERLRRARSGLKSQ